MNIKIWLVLFICLPFMGQAQITITTQIPNTGMLLKEQLWNMIVTNNSNDIADVKVELDITDVVLGQSVLNASSGKITIGKGIKIITSRDIQPIVYNYVATEFAGNYAPCGTYSLHYRLLIEVPGKGEVPVADDITRIYVTPLSPPLLSLPADKSGIETVYPQFAWMPPTPMEMFSPLLYDINVVVIEEGQSAKEAIEINKPVYFNTNIQNPSEKMPSSFEQLQQGKSYAWQVVARSGSACAAASDVWMFTLGKDSITKIIESAAFTKLSRSNTEVTTAQEGNIKMEYINNIGDKQVKCVVYKAGEKQKEGHKAIHFKLKLVDGQNYLSYNINKKQKLDEKTVYEVSLKNSRGEEWLMRFMPVYSSK
jgi:hypothetical protein